jgi:hypothetical protein
LFLFASLARWDLDPNQHRRAEAELIPQAQRANAQTNASQRASSAVKTVAAGHRRQQGGSAEASSVAGVQTKQGAGPTAGDEEGDDHNQLTPQQMRAKWLDSFAESTHCHSYS